jgi:hypothetical protein
MKRRTFSASPTPRVRLRPCGLAPPPARTSLCGVENRQSLTCETTAAVSSERRSCAQSRRPRPLAPFSSTAGRRRRAPRQSARPASDCHRHDIEPDDRQKGVALRAHRRDRDRGRSDESCLSRSSRIRCRELDRRFLSLELARRLSVLLSLDSRGGVLRAHRSAVQARRAPTPTSTLALA